LKQYEVTYVETGWSALLLDIPEVFAACLGQETGYPEVLRGCPQSTQINAGEVT